LERLAEGLGASGLLLLVLNGEGHAIRHLVHGPTEWPLEKLRGWLEEPGNWSLPKHTLLHAANLEGMPAQIPPETNLLLVEDEEPLGCLLIEPDHRRTTALPPEALEIARLLARSERLESLVETERALRETVAEILDHGLIAVDSDGIVLRFEGKAPQILGVPAEDAVGRPCDDVFRSMDLSENPIRSALKGSVKKVELFILRRGGGEVPVSVSLDRILDEEQRVLGAVALFRDISLERALEEHARRRERLASIGELAAGVAHEIRNPLTGIHTCAQVLHDRLSEQQRSRRLVETILHEGVRLNRIVQGLLNFAQPGKPQLRKARIEDCVRKVLELEGAHLEESGIRVSMDFQEDIPAIYLDPDQISQVLINLLRNAKEAMPEGGELTLTVSTVMRHPHRRKGLGRRSSDRIRFPGQSPLRPFVRIRLQDTGPGIPPETLPRIFNPFFTTRSEGTGLGLSVSQSIIQEHGGLLSIQSPPERGTVVEVDLPVERRTESRRSEMT
jgi:PAS domain S-box-containing protein